MRIGIDLGGTNIAAAIVDDDYKTIVQKSISTRKGCSASAIIKDMAMLALDLVEAAGLRLAQIDAIGIGSPGTLDKAKGVVLYSNNIQWEHVELRADIQRYLDKPVFIDNDANCAVLGEFIAGAAVGFRSAVMITLGTGVGGGIILDQKIYSGFNAAANIVGHTTLISGGELCNCGRRGCWEVYASATGLIRMANQATDENPSSSLSTLRMRDGELNGKNIFEAERLGDAVAQKLLTQYRFYVAEGVTNLVNVLQPEVVVLGGGISKAGDRLLGPILEQVARDVYCKSVALPQIKIAQLGNDAGVIGAAFLGDYQREHPGVSSSGAKVS